MSIYKHSGYSVSEKHTHRAIGEALDTARNRHSVKDKRGRLVCSDYELAAVDYDGRTKWTKALCDEFEKRFDLPNSETEFFWFCIVHSGCIDRFRSTHYRVFPRQCIRHYRTALRGLSYVAMIEPSIYASSTKIVPPALQCIYDFEPIASWHVHGLAWGPSRRKMREHFNAVEASGVFVPIAPNMKGCWAKFIQPQQVGFKLAYMNKTPREVNRIICRNPDALDRNYEFDQKAALCRPGQHIQYLGLLAKYNMNDLAFAGGEGCDILRTVKAPFLRRIAR